MKKEINIIKIIGQIAVIIAALVNLIDVIQKDYKV